MVPRIGQRLGQQPKPLTGQRGEQASPVGEVVGGRGMRHPGAAGQLA
jgi:hypothetical protein